VPVPAVPVVPPPAAVPAGGVLLAPAEGNWLEVPALLLAVPALGVVSGVASLLQPGPPRVANEASRVKAANEVRFMSVS
jgi:hypothetical protein